MTYRVLVTGSREWTDAVAVRAALDRVLAERGSFVLVHGACVHGADAIAETWWYEHRDRVEVERHRADWRRYGRSAGCIRNEAMARSGVDECLAFILDASPGSMDCAAHAEARGIPTTRDERQTKATVDT